MEELITKLGEAKKAVISMVNDANCMVNFHGLTYWAGEVERLREEIKKLL